MIRCQIILSFYLLKMRAIQNQNLGSPSNLSNQNQSKAFIPIYTLFFAFFYAFLALFGPLYGLFGPFLTLFNEKNIIFSPFRKKFPGKA